MAQKLFIVPDGGLANRMRAIASGVFLSQQTNAEPTIVWRRNKLCNIALDQIFEINAIRTKILNPGLIEYKAFYEIPRRTNLYISAVFQKILFSHCYFDSDSFDYYIQHPYNLAKQVKDKESNVMIFSGQEFYDYPRELYRTIFLPTPQVKARVIEILGNATPTVSCQIRRGDHKLAIANSSVDIFVKTMEEWLSHNSSEIFYLATDDEFVKRTFKTTFGNNVIFNTTKADRASESGMIDALAEIIIMSKTSMIFGSPHSSYCEAASQYGNTALKIIQNP